MNEIAKLFYDIDEPLAAGIFEIPEASYEERLCRGYRRYYENCDLREYNPASPLYPCADPDKKGAALHPTYCRQCRYHENILKNKSEKAYEIFKNFYTEHDNYFELDSKSDALQNFCSPEGWNHSALDLERILEEGLIGYEKRILAMKDDNLRDALFDLLEGIRAYLRRSVEYLESVGAEERLITALKKVPEHPAETAYEAFVSANFTFCFDSCDNLGYVESWLPKYWKGEDLTKEMRAIMENIQHSGSWSITVGPDHHELTKQWIKAAGNGLSRPMIELRTSENMPSDVWNAALDSILSGNPQISFYNEEAIQRRLKERIPEAPEEDIKYFAGMGCTETALSGMTYCGGIDCNISVLRIFDKCMREKLDAFNSFEEFYEEFMTRLHRAQDAMVRYVNDYFNERAKKAFSPIRSLFTRGCIENEKGFFQGGAKYTFAVPSDSGIPNTVDSLLAIKELVFDKKMYSPSEFIAALDAEDAEFRNQLSLCPSYGVSDENADNLMYDLTKRFYSHYRSAKLDLGLGFFPTSHQFIRHIPVGSKIGATPDGRRAKEAVADSIAAINGKALEGPTSMLLSASKFHQEMVYGIPVLNLSINSTFGRDALRDLIKTYFKMNGTQIQITCHSRKTLLEAQKNPDKYKDLSVRVGGYSEYFRNLSTEYQNIIIARTMFE